MRDVNSFFKADHFARVRREENDEKNPSLPHTENMKKMCDKTAMIRYVIDFMASNSSVSKGQKKGIPRRGYKVWALMHLKLHMLLACAARSSEQPFYERRACDAVKIEKAKCHGHVDRVPGSPIASQTRLMSSNILVFSSS